MKSEKLSLKNIKNVLSRSEMKKVLAGSGGSDCCYCYNVCTSTGWQVVSSNCAQACNGPCSSTLYTGCLWSIVIGPPPGTGGGPIIARNWLINVTISNKGLAVTF